MRRQKTIINLLRVSGIFLSVFFVSCPLMANEGAPVLTKVKNKVMYEGLAFDRLFFKYHPPMDIENPDGSITPKADVPMAIPDPIKALDGKKVMLQGFVMPLESDGKRVKTFLLVDQLVTCLFCVGLGMDQWVLVEVKDPKGVVIKDEEYENPVTVYGTIAIGEDIKDKVVVSLYRLQADVVETAKKGFNVF